MNKVIFLAVIIALATAEISFAENLMRVAVSVANVRATPSEHNGKYEYDPQQETQVELNDPVLVLETKDGWAHVECPDQMEFTHNNRWQGYPGWIKLIDLSTDVTSAKVLAQPTIDYDHVREKIIHKAYLHVGNPYLWGGRSLQDPNNKSVATGVDCSGLINWSYKELGLAVPRDAHEQFMKARRVNPLTLKPADMIFLAKVSNPQKIFHVMFYTGDGTILEAPQSGENIRQMPFQEKFGKSLSQMKNGEQVGDNIVYFGTFFGTSE